MNSLMPDQAHIETDEEILKMERLIATEYRKANKEVEAKLTKYLKAFEKKDETWRRWVEDGVKTEKEYREWRMGQILVGKRWQEMADTLAEDYMNARQIAEGIIDKTMPAIYALNHNYATFEVETGSLIDTSYTLYSRNAVERLWRENPKLYKKPGRKVLKQIKEGKLKLWEKQKIQSVMIQGILQGEGTVDLAKRLRKVTKGEYAAAVRNARTMATGIENAGRIDAYARATDKGIRLRKQWIATLDDRTRHEHAYLDGMIVDLDQPFFNDYGAIMYPGDPNADPANVYNCRCTILSVIDGFEIDASDLSLRDTTNLDGMSYNEWKSRKKSTSNPIDLPEMKRNAIRGARIREYRQ